MKSQRQFTLPLHFLLSLSLVMVGGWPLVTHSATLNLATTPLYLGTNAAPNIMFIIDDSGSMDWEAMTNDYENNGLMAGLQPNNNRGQGRGALKGRANGGGGGRCGAADGTFGGIAYGVESPYRTFNGNPCDIADAREWRFRNYQFNPMYYNPNRTYAPWPGLDSAGVPFADMPVAAAKFDPYLANSDTLDLTVHNGEWVNAQGGSWGTSDEDRDGIPDGFFYYTWNDTNNDGLFDDGEETEFAVKDADAATQQNFANWFSYYRSRELVAKAAYGRVIAEAKNVRMGMVTLHNNNNVNTAVAMMNDNPATGAKATLLDALYRINSRRGTPLRSALNECGKYFSCVGNDFFGTCPILSAAEGGACQQNFAVMMTDGFYNGADTGLGNTDSDGAGAFDGGAYADGWSETLADVAMHYYENDLQPRLDNLVPITRSNSPARHQHMVTYTVSFGINGTLAGDPPNTTDPFTWPDPTTDEAHKIDDLRHAAFNGRGQYLSANDPQALADAIQAAIEDIIDRTSTASAVSLDSSNIASGSTIYQARFETTTWSGQLNYLPISADGVIGAATLEAGSLLDSKLPNNRVIVTRDSATGAGVPFRWASLSATQQTELDKGSNGRRDRRGAARVDYLRGVRSGEESNGGVFRDRTGVLGDIIHSAPAYVSTPPFAYSFDNYAAFRSANASRRKMAYLGANDGMLHGFDAVTGEEVLAYIPSNLYTRLGELTDPNYTHNYYVDGTPTVGDAYFGGSWHTLLIGSLRAGGQGIFALDVTDPNVTTETAAAGKVLWEFSDLDDPDLGYTFSQPVLARLADNRWVVIFGNGYNNTEADGSASTTGNAVLYVLDASNGSLIAKLDTGAGMSVDPTGANRNNGLATPALVDTNADHAVDHIYAGDLFGNLWRFDMTGTPAIANGGIPMFIARAPTGEAQAITTRPMVGWHPKYDNFMVYFGTGKYFEQGDNASTGVPTQTFYGVWDKNTPLSTSITRSTLLEQVIFGEFFDASGDEIRVTSDNDIDWSRHSGWSLDLVNQQTGNNMGELQITESLLRNGRIIFTTLLPSQEVCGVGGSGWLMELDANNGGRLDWAVFDLNDDLIFNEDDFASLAALGLSSVDNRAAAANAAAAAAAATAARTGTAEDQAAADAAAAEAAAVNKASVSGKKANGIPSRPAIAYNNEDGHDEEHTLLNNSDGSIQDEITNDGVEDNGRVTWQRLR